MKSVTDLPLLQYNQVLQALNNLQSKNWLRDRALIAAIYLSGCRIREIIGIKCKDEIIRLRQRNKELKAKLIIEKNKKTQTRLEKQIKLVIERGQRIKKKLEHDPESYYREPLRKYQLRRVIDGKYKFLQIEGLSVLKRREKARVLKNPPMSYHKEKAFIDVLWKYKGVLPKDESVLFSFSRRQALRIIKKAFGDEFFPHYLRHLRVTRLIGPEYGFNLEETRVFLGSKSASSLEPYSHLATSDIRKKMR